MDCFFDVLHMGFVGFCFWIFWIEFIKSEHFTYLPNGILWNMFQKMLTTVFFNGFIASSLRCNAERNILNWLNALCIKISIHYCINLNLIIYYIEYTILFFNILMLTCAMWSVVDFPAYSAFYKHHAFIKYKKSVNIPKE